MFLLSCGWSNAVFCGFVHNIPSTFAAALLPCESHSIILQDPGQKRKWVVSYLVINKSRSLRGNWKRLVLDNNLEEGDACLFELIKNKDLLTMIAHISKG